MLAASGGPLRYREVGRARSRGPSRWRKRDARRDAAAGRRRNEGRPRPPLNIDAPASRSGCGADLAAPRAAADIADQSGARREQHDGARERHGCYL